VLLPLEPTKFDEVEALEILQTVQGDLELPSAAVARIEIVRHLSVLHVAALQHPCQLDVEYLRGFARQTTQVERPLVNRNLLGSLVSARVCLELENLGAFGNHAFADHLEALLLRNSVILENLVEICFKLIKLLLITVMAGTGLRNVEPVVVRLLQGDHLHVQGFFVEEAVLLVNRRLLINFRLQVLLFRHDAHLVMDCSTRLQLGAPVGHVTALLLVQKVLEFVAVPLVHRLVLPGKVVLLLEVGQLGLQRHDVRSLLSRLLEVRLLPLREQGEVILVVSSVTLLAAHGVLQFALQNLRKMLPSRVNKKV